MLKQALLAYDPYCRDECHHLDDSLQAAKTYQHFLDIIRQVSLHKRLPKSELHSRIEEALSPTDVGTEGLISSMEVAVRLWLMINIDSTETNTEGYTSMKTSLAWPEDLSITEVISNYLQQRGHRFATRNSQFSKDLNVYNLEKIGGYHILWTNDILDHLAMKGDNAVAIFNTASALHLIGDSAGDIFPPGFIDETLRTIALLLPSADSACNKWLETREKTQNLDPGIRQLPSAPRDVGAYAYWLDRLLIIEESFDQHEPATLSQWYHDRRKKVQLYTFWVAVAVLILTIVFGLISSVASVVQAWASVKALNRSS